MSVGLSQWTSRPYTLTNNNGRMMMCYLCLMTYKFRCFRRLYDRFFSLLLSFDSIFGINGSIYQFKVSKSDSLQCTRLIDACFYVSSKITSRVSKFQVIFRENIFVKNLETSIELNASASLFIQLFCIVETILSTSVDLFSLSMYIDLKEKRDQ